MFGGVYRRSVASDKHHRPKESEFIAGLFVGGTGGCSQLEALFQLEQPESVANRLCEPTSRNKSTNERNIRNVQISLVEVGGGQYKDDLRIPLSYKGGRP